MRQQHVDLIVGIADIAREQLRETLGRRVRDVWLDWARMQPDAKRSWINPWEDIEERHREVDRDIGEALFEMGRQSVVDELLGSVDAWRSRLAQDVDPNKFDSAQEAEQAQTRRQVALQVVERVREMLEARHVDGTRLEVRAR